MTSLAATTFSCSRATPNRAVELPDAADHGQAADDTPSLTRRLAKGDEAAFREFHARYFDRLYQFLLWTTRGQEQEAQDALQETLVRVARYVRPFETEEILWSWLKRLARSAACDAGRRQARYRAMLEGFTAHWRTSHDESGSSADGLPGLLAELLSGLELDDRRLVEGKYLLGATVRELASQSGLTEKSVESRLGRLRHLLREQLLEKLNHERR